MFAPPGNAINVGAAKLWGNGAVLIQGAGHGIRPLGKVAAIVCVVNAGGTERRVIFGAMEGHSWVPVRFEH